MSTDFNAMISRFSYPEKVENEKIEIMYFLELVHSWGHKKEGQSQSSRLHRLPWAGQFPGQSLTSISAVTLAVMTGKSLRYLRKTTWKIMDP